MQVLVTGGLGYIGSHTSVLLLEKGYDLVIVDDLSNSNEKVIENISQITSKVPVFEKIDLKDKESVSKLFINYDFDGIIHFAAHKSVNESVNYPEKYFKNNVGYGTKEHRDMIIKYGITKIHRRNFKPISTIFCNQ